MTTLDKTLFEEMWSKLFSEELPLPDENTLVEMYNHHKSKENYLTYNEIVDKALRVYFLDLDIASGLTLTLDFIPEWAEDTMRCMILIFIARNGYDKKWNHSMREWTDEVGTRGDPSIP